MKTHGLFVWRNVEWVRSGAGEESADFFGCGLFCSAEICRQRVSNGFNPRFGLIEKQTTTLRVMICFYAGSGVSNGFVPRFGLIEKQTTTLRVMICFYAGSGVSNGFVPRFGLIKKTNRDLWSQFVFYAGSGGRTRTVSLPTDFESASSANSNIPACLSLYHSPAANASISPNNSFRSLHY